MITKTRQPVNNGHDVNKTNKPPMQRAADRLGIKYDSKFPVFSIVDMGQIWDEMTEDEKAEEEAIHEARRPKLEK